MLPLQLLYLALSVGWLAANYVLSRWDGRPLTPTTGPAALVIYVLYALALYAKAHGFAAATRWSMIGFVLVLGYGGVILHLRRRREMARYRGRAAWLGAIAVINAFGVAVNVAAALGWR